MRLSVSRPPYLIPSYSLTGDLLAYLKCGLQYRYHNRGALPPSKPVQLWFGEFIHGVLEEAYLRWAKNAAPRSFPWNWSGTIRPIELEVYRRLLARGLHQPFRLFCPYSPSNLNCNCPGNPTDHKLIASRRAEAAINTWGAHLFPLISEAEVRLQGMRPMPGSIQDRRAEYYEIAGIVDVLGSVQLAQAPRDNLIARYLTSDRSLGASRSLTGVYEVIVDYKGTRRPSTKSELWEHYRWQVLTYAWLRAQQPHSAPVLAGIVIFVNELEPSEEELEELKEDLAKGQTDIIPDGDDRKGILGWRPGQPLPELSFAFRQRRSLLIEPVSAATVEDSLRRFDMIVCDIELSVLEETRGKGVIKPWERRPSGGSYIAPEERTCTACDFRHFCSLAVSVGQGGAPKAP